MGSRIGRVLTQIVGPVTRAMIERPCAPAELIAASLIDAVGAPSKARITIVITVGRLAGHVRDVDEAGVILQRVGGEAENQVGEGLGCPGDWPGRWRGTAAAAC